MLPPSPRLPGLLAKRKPTTDIDVAREVLANARAALDRAVAALPVSGGNEEMAPPHLLPLLVCAVQARHHLRTLETIPDRSV
jgi:hypothetical protein